MKLIKRGVYALLVALPLAVSMFIFPNAAQATSDYDNLLHTSPTLFVYADGATKSQKMDISQSWYNSLGQTYAKRLEQNIGWPTNFMTELNAIKSSGGSLGLFMQETQDGNLVGVVGSRDPHAYCEFAGNISLGKFMCSTHAGYGYVYAYYFTHNTYGGNGCAYGSGICSNDGMAIYDAPVVQTGTEGYTIFGIPYSNLASYKFYFMDFDVTYPSGYAGAILPTSPPPAKYVAMGDSFSSGEGNPPFEAGTDVDNVNLCHRSTTAYPRQVQNALNLGSTAFVACSGAVSDYIINEYNQENTELPQAAFVSSSTNLVTITIGGNDVGFGSVLTSCTLPTNESGTTEEKHQIEHDACIRAIDDAQTTASSAALQSKLETVFS
ncbi:MAG: SGNH/GDSL hydrolase family protein, partial [Ktedonobacteraceae bacterium]|nr:SGNH/GDSL hydrolase family protein [Ktedonobacteraceae bacterium]